MMQAGRSAQRGRQKQPRPGAKNRPPAIDRNTLRALYGNKEAAHLSESLRQFNSPDEIQNILSERFKAYPFSSLSGLPHPHELLNNKEAAALVCETMARNERILIVGDYDADGVCATCIMLDFFEALGYEKVCYAMPNRFKHGYGFSKSLFESITNDYNDIALIITVDNGVSSFEAARLCRAAGIKFIITDHHTLEIDEAGKIKVPDCELMVNPQQAECSFPFKNICGALVAWYLCYAILLRLEELAPTESSLAAFAPRLSKEHLKGLLVLVSIAIISDVMPLNAINHTICRYGLNNLLHSDKPAFQTIARNFKCPIDSQMLGFRFIPMLNAAGRMDDGALALEFLRAKNQHQAEKLFKKLGELNKQRKKLQQEVLDLAFSSLETTKQNPFICFALGSGWHEGVLGIAAGRIADERRRPSFVLTNINGMCKGSGRSYGDVDLIASLQKVGHLLSRYGGHVGAVGLEIREENVEEFLRLFTPVSFKAEEKHEILGSMPGKLVNSHTFLCIESYEPYGNGNSQPKFFFELPIHDYKRTNQGFLEFHLDCPSYKPALKAMFFNSKYSQASFVKGDILQFSATLALDSQSFSHKWGLDRAYSLDEMKSLLSRPQQGACIMLIIDKIHGLRSQPL